MKKHQGQYQLLIQDNGNRPPKDLYREGSEGMALIKTYVDQLYGQHEIDKTNGLSHIITFNPKN